MERNLTSTQKAWIKSGYEHAESIHEVLCEELGRIATSEELQEDTSIQETGELIYGGTATIERRHFDSDKEYEQADYELDLSECWELFDEGINNFIDELKASENSIIDADKSPVDAKEYYVNIEGENVKVDVKNDEEYSCLLNCLEGYYIYGIGRDDEEDDECEDGDEDIDK